MLNKKDLARFASRLAIIALMMTSIKGFTQALDNNPPPSEDNAPEIGLSFRHIVILQADLDNIWGTYFFAVNNNTQEQKSFKTFLMLPRESIDFKAQDGLEDQDLKLDENGQLFLEKEFSPGVSLLGVSFQVKADQVGNDTISFLPPFDVQELSVAVPSKSGISVEGELFKQGVPPMLADGRYKGMQITNVKKDQVLEIEISGIPKNRILLWIVSGIITALIILLGIGLTIKTKGGRGSEPEDQII